jgi:phage baseplate assembly protein W
MAKFVDLDINFDRNPFTGDVVVRTEEEAVKRSLRNLLLYKRGEKPFHPEISSGLIDLLFEPVDPIMVMELRNRITHMIARYEPRIKEAEVDVAHVIDKNEIRVTIKFAMFNIQRVFSTTITLQRMR